MRRHTRRVGRQVADALPGPGPRLARRLAVLAGVVRPHPLPLVSIIVPVHAVEEYLSECLDSLLAQTHDNLQIVLVDDGSPDRSLDVMTAYARRDARIEILQRSNAGPGAARNHGVREARGTYLMFVDGDDTLDPGAVATHVASLQRTHSDFSVAAYRRFSRAGRWSAGWWIKEAHAHLRQRTTLAESPDVQVNAVMWSKCFRRRFWLNQHLSFPEGVLYEDQLVSTKAYARARSFDVLPDVVHNWRKRHERTSITQQIAGSHDLASRLAASQSVLDFLAEQGLCESRDERLVQYLRHDFQFSIRAAQHGDEHYWTLLRDGLHRLTESMTADTWSRVSVQQRIAVRLVLEDLRPETTWFTGLGHSNPKNSPATIRDGAVYLDSPARLFTGTEAGDPALAFAAHQLGLVTSIRGLRWTDDGLLEIAAWAYVDNVSLNDPRHPFDVRVWVETGRSDGKGKRPSVPMTVRMEPTTEVTAATKHRYADYERSSFVATIDPRRLVSELSGTRAMKWRVMVEVHAAGIVRTGPLREPYRAGSAGYPFARFVDGAEVVPRYGSRAALRIQVSPIRCHVVNAQVSDRVLNLQVQGTPGFTPSEIEITFAAERGAVRVPLDRLGDDQARGSVFLPQPRRNAEVMEDAPLQGLVRIISLDGLRTPAAVVDRKALAHRQYGSQHIAVTEFGNLCVIDEQRTVRIDRVSIDGRGLLIISGFAVGVHPAELTLSLDSPAARAVGALRATGGSAFEAAFEMVHDPWQLGERPLPSGQYLLTARAWDSYGGMRLVAVQIEQQVIEQLPISHLDDQRRLQLRRTRKRRLRVDLMPSLTDAERGARHQQRLQDELGQRLASPSRSASARERGAVLFRSNYGEIAGCNQLAIHRELMRRGTDLRLYWAVRDYSVRVPVGGIPIVHDSAEWYRLLHDADFYLDNMHQPIYHRKPRHQVQVQTFHGYPFKLMGRDNWRRQRREAAHVQSYLDRAADWDHFVSPAHYASDLLREAFGYPGEMLEIGYPRNDILCLPQAADRASEIRMRLGIRPDQTAILYAPTFRDDLARNDFRAAMVDFLDVHLLSAALGPEYVIMVRGHAFNARVQDRIGSSGRVLDVTDYPDATELILASDTAILDYSSIRFDYGLTDKPMLFLVPDLENYLAVARGGILPYEPTAPGPLLTDTDEVIAALGELDRIRDDWAAARKAFRASYLDLDDGYAAQRLVDTVFADHVEF